MLDKLRQNYGAIAANSAAAAYATTPGGAPIRRGLDMGCGLTHFFGGGSQAALGAPRRRRPSVELKPNPDGTYPSAPGG